MLNGVATVVSHPASALPPRSRRAAGRRVHRLSKNIGTPTALPLTRVPFLEHLSQASCFNIFCPGRCAMILDGWTMPKVPKKSVEGAVRDSAGLEFGAAEPTGEVLRQGAVGQRLPMGPAGPVGAAGDC